MEVEERHIGYQHPGMVGQAWQELCIGNLPLQSSFAHSVGSKWPCLTGKTGHECYIGVQQMNIS